VAAHAQNIIFFPEIDRLS